MIALITWFWAQAFWFPIALIPVFVQAPNSGAVSLLLILMSVCSVMTSIHSCSYNGWLRDLIPQTILGHLFSRRFVLAASSGIVFGLGAAAFIDYWYRQVSGERHNVTGCNTPLISEKEVRVTET